MHRKMNALFVAALATAICTVAVAPAGAQTAGRVRVTIPFDFSVGNARLEAGDYTVQVLESGVLLFTSGIEKGRQFVALTTHGHSPNVSMTPHLVFTWYGKDVFLKQIFLSGDGEYNEVPASKMEKHLRQASTERASLLINPSL